MKTIYSFLLKSKNSHYTILFLICSFILSSTFTIYYFPLKMPNWTAYLQATTITFYFLCLIICIYLIPLIKDRILVYISLFTLTYIITGNFIVFLYFGVNYSESNSHYFSPASLSFKIITVAFWSIRICILNLLFHEFTRKFYTKSKNKLFYKFNTIILISTILLIFLSFFHSNKEIFLYFTFLVVITQVILFISHKKSFFILFLFLFLITTSTINSIRILDIYGTYSKIPILHDSVLFSKNALLISSLAIFFQILLLINHTFNHVKNKNLSLLSNIKSQKIALYKTQLKAANFEINLLTAAIKPHFLFNCLNSIEILISVDPTKAEESIYNLSYFYRYYLLNLKGELVWFKEELAFVERYVKMENVRFNDRIILSIQTDSNYEFKIPPMTLQLVVENAIVHSITKSLNKGDILIQVKKLNSHYRIKVSNKKEFSLEENSYHKKGAGVGIKLLTQRLELAYGKESTNLTIENTQSQYAISFSVPLKY